MLRRTDRLRHVLPILVLTGCGYIGEPLPPALNIPTRVTDLAAVERGPKLIVQFTRPAASTEGLILKNPPRLDLYIGNSNGPPFNTQTWANAAKRLEVPNDKSAVRFETPAAEWYGKEVVIGLKAANQSGHDGGWSNFITLPIIQALVMPNDLKARDVANGVELTWIAPPGTFRIFRRGPQDPQWLQIGTSEQPSYTDSTIEYGKSYQYLVQAIQKAGDKLAESDLSEVKDFTPEDKFPPAIPTGLTAIAGTQSIELVWDRNTEPDLAGYRIYRANEAGPFERIAEGQENPSYSDRKIEAGKRYRYAVSAFDKVGNESKMSQPVEAALP